MRRRRNKKTSGTPQNKATQQGNRFLVRDALRDPQKVTNKTLIAIDGDACDRKVIHGITQSREAEQQGHAFVVFTDRTFATILLDQSISVQ